MNIFPPPPGEAHVWRAHLAASNALAWPDCLDETERQRAMRLIMPARRRLFAFAHAMLRMVLGAYLRIDPACLRFAIRDGGKPELHGAALRFSLSHSAEAALVAVASDRELGVDLEQVTDRLDTDALAGAALTAAERDDLQNLDDDSRRRAVLRSWTRKEALLKAQGLGLACDLRDLTLVQPRWTLIDLPLGRAWQASLAFDGRLQALRLFCLSWPQ